MDPKSSPQLDPKLQEAYDRVMGISLDNSLPTTQPTPPALNTPTDPLPTPSASQDLTSPAIPPMEPVNPPPSIQIPPTPQPSIPDEPPTTPSIPTLPVTEPSVAPVLPAEQPMTTVENTASVMPHAFVAKGNEKKISPVILVLGAVVFLLLYTLIWIKVFNIPVPFIN